MTVSYQYEVASSTSGGFTRLLFMWRGSLYKLIYRELFMFMFAFGIISALYRNVFTPDQKRYKWAKKNEAINKRKRVLRGSTLTFYVLLITIPNGLIAIVSSSTNGGFTRLLFIWGRSLYKLIYRELFIFMFTFGILSAMYRNVFNPEQKRLFEKIASYCDAIMAQIPLSFVLGFYVVHIATRWWSQYLAIPWPDRIMHSLALYVGGTDEQSRILRRTLMRYLNLSLVLVLRSISSAVKRRFPTLDHLVEAGFMNPTELEMFTSVPSMEFNTYWIPCAWFVSMVKDARKSKMITDAQGLKVVMEEFSEFRSKCGLLWSYDWISIPLVYTQVVTIATYSYCIIAVIGRQYIESIPKPHQIEIDIYIPIFTILQFLFYMGLLKVAEQLINPFGDDDEDFELNWLIDRHTKVSYLGVDSLTLKCPPLVKDKYFNDANLTLPYTGAAFAYKKKTYRGSVHNMQVPEAQQTMFLPEIIEEEDEPQRTPKNSLPNLFVSTPSPSAGIWRQSVCSTDGDRMSTAEEGISVASTPEVKENKMMKFLFPSSRKTPIPKLDINDMHINSAELKQWSSNSTIDSYCSTVGALDSSVDIVHGEQREIKNSPRSHRRSSGSGHWKGVRWKPVLDDSCGDVWSDNSALRNAASSIALGRPRTNTGDALDLPQRRSTFHTEGMGSPGVLMPCNRLSVIDKAATASMPNLLGSLDDTNMRSNPKEAVFNDRQPKSL